MGTTVIEIRGKLQKIMPGRKIRTGYLCELIIFREADENQYGEKKGKDQYYPVAMFAESFADVQQKVGAHVGKNVAVECYLNGKEFSGREGLSYTVNLTLKSMASI